LVDLNKDVNNIATKVNEDMQKQENFKTVVAIQKAFGDEVKVFFSFLFFFIVIFF